MDITTLEIPTGLLDAAKLTPEEAKTQLALRLYQLHKLNEKQAGELAGDPKVIEAAAWKKQEIGQFELNDFLDWASHDLKTPLNAVIGFSKVVLKGIDGPVNDTQVTDLTTVFNSGQRMLGLISNLVDVARLNIGQIAIYSKELDLADLINEIVERWKIQHPGIPLATEIRIAFPIFQVDQIQMRNIISHLLTFASIRLTEGSLSLAARDNADGLNVTVQSTGKKSPDKMEMDWTMLSFITTSLIKLHGGKMDEPQETEDGFLLKFTLPRQ